MAGSNPAIATSVVAYGSSDRWSDGARTATSPAFVDGGRTWAYSAPQASRRCAASRHAWRRGQPAPHTVTLRAGAAARYVTVRTAVEGRTVVRIG